MFADRFVVTYDNPGVQEATLPNAIAACSGSNPPCVLGVENFDSWAGGPFTTDYGTGGVITGSYSGAMLSTSADQYGGAGGTGKYVALNPGTSYTIDLTTTTDGVNYFGMWWSALDQRSSVQFYDNGELVLDFTPGKYIDLVGACPSASNPFCGNPNTNFLGKNAGEQYSYLNFYDTTGYFDEIVFTQGSGGGFESDNQEVAYLNPVTVEGDVIEDTPEPGTFWLLGIGIVLAGAGRLRNRSEGLRVVAFRHKEG